MLLVGKSSVSEVTKADADRVEYFPIDDNEKWKVGSWKHSRNYQYKKWVDGSSWF
jgi:hypothetical protein